MSLPSTYEEYQNLSVSEKEVLVRLHAAKRLLGWVNHEASIYSLNPFTQAVVSKIEEDGTALDAAESLEALEPGQYFHDRNNQTLYIETLESAHPNSVFLALTFPLFFSKGGRKLPHDLDSGFDVFWEPLVKDTSEFGVGVDHVNQIGEAIEGAGSITLLNNQEFWAPKFEKLYFENQDARIYSWSPVLLADEAKLIYRGKVIGKQYSDDEVKFQLNDQLASLRAEVSMLTVGEIEGAKVPPRVRDSRQRLVYGQVRGHRPTNIDQVIPDEGYLLDGTLAMTAGSNTVSGTGTSFLSDLSPGDQLRIDGVTDAVTIESIASDDSLELSEEAERNLSNATYRVIPDLPKRYTNRSWVVAGHALREPTTTVTSAASSSVFSVADTRDFDRDATITVGVESAVIRRMVPGNRIRLQTNLLAPPDIGTVVKRLPLINVRLNQRLLQGVRDYTVDAENGRLTLDPLAEFNVAPVKTLNGTLSFSAESRTVTGTDTQFTKQLTSNCWIKLRTQSDWVEVLQIESDTSLAVRVAPGYTGSGAGHYKDPDVYEEGRSVLTCDVMGATDDGTTSGNWLKTGPQIVEDLLKRAGLSDDIDEDSFARAANIAHYRVQLVIPERYNDTKVPIYRQSINLVNQSVFGELVQTPDFKLSYRVLSPGRSVGDAKQFLAVDCLKWAIRSNVDKIVSEVKLRYLKKEYDFQSLESSSQYVEHRNKNAEYLAKTGKVFDQDTLLIDETAAQIMAERWAFLFSMAMSVIRIETKLQAARMTVGDLVDLHHPRLFERLASQAKRKTGAVTSAKKSGSRSVIEFEDLANAFSRCAIITENDHPPWDDSTDTERLFGGHITDSYGMQDNDPDTAGLNLIW